MSRHYSKTVCNFGVVLLSLVFHECKHFSRRILPFANWKRYPHWKIFFLLIFEVSWFAFKKTKQNAPVTIIKKMKTNHKSVKKRIHIYQLSYKHSNLNLSGHIYAVSQEILNQNPLDCYSNWPVLVEPRIFCPIHSAMFTTETFVVMTASWLLRFSLTWAPLVEGVEGWSREAWVRETFLLFPGHLYLEPRAERSLCSWMPSSPEQNWPFW